MTQDVAYEALPPERRADLHRRIALAIEALDADRVPGQDEILAHHFSKAEEWPKALKYLVRAAEKAASAFAIREALALYDHALEAVDRLGRPADVPTVIEIHQARAGLYFVLSEFNRSRAEVERVLALAREIGDRASEGKALAAIAWAAMCGARSRRGRRECARGDRGRGADGGDAVARSYFTMGFVRAVSGGLDDAMTAIDRALATSRGSGERATRSLSLSVAGLLKNWEGEYEAASRQQAEGLVLAREHHLLVPLLFNLFVQGITLTGKGDYEAALALFREGLALAEKVGDEAIHHRLLNCLGWLHAELGDLDAALEFNRQSAEVGRRRDDPGTFPNAEINLGEIYLAKGDVAEAANHFESAYRFWGNPRTSQWMRWRYAMRLFAGMGELGLVRGDLDRATEFADRSLELATRTNSRKHLAKGWRLRGRIAVGPTAAGRRRGGVPPVPRERRDDRQPHADLGDARGVGGAPPGATATGPGGRGVSRGARRARPRQGKPGRPGAPREPRAHSRRSGACTSRAGLRAGPVRARSARLSGAACTGPVVAVTLHAR